MASIGFDYLKNLPLYLSEEETADPMLVLKSFFLIQKELVEWRELLNTWLKGICTPKPIWHGGSPGDFLYHVKMIKKLVEGAWILKSQESLPDPVEQLHPSNLTTSKVFDYNDKIFFWWKLYPLFLTEEEMFQPYTTFKNFFSCRNLSEWRHELDEWAEESISNSAWEGFTSHGELIQDMESLHKLLEASYLVYLRSLNPINNPQK
ncbi:hypothetical protein [Litoribacter populi]|uniref:hypothetical protein n=1 Tax=Litoribacter populi TaxID=2598460 RepID=UPI00117F6E43|nr:hypothetical protein [Litoribacter populi]